MTSSLPRLWFTSRITVYSVHDKTRTGCGATTLQPCDQHRPLLTAGIRSTRRHSNKPKKNKSGCMRSIHAKRYPELVICSATLQPPPSTLSRFVENDSTHTCKSHFTWCAAAAAINNPKFLPFHHFSSRWRNPAHPRVPCILAHRRQSPAFNKQDSLHLNEYHIHVQTQVHTLHKIWRYGYHDKMSNRQLRNRIFILSWITIRSFMSVSVSIML